MLCAKVNGSSESVDWRVSKDPEPYLNSVTWMENRVAEIKNGAAPETVWLLQHPPLYTAGTSAQKFDLIDPRFPVFETGRGGQYTYHGPGQRVAYVMLDLLRRKTSSGPDLRAYICALEEWLIRTLADFDIKGERRDGRVGIWVVTKNGEKKIAAVGVRVRRWVTYHGVSVNVNPDLGHFGGIVPCGITEHGVTSFQDLGVQVSMKEVDSALQKNFAQVFG